MKLHTLKNSFALPLAPCPLPLIFIPYPHYLPLLCPCAYFKTVRKGIFFYQERVIPCCLKGVGNIFKYGFAVMIYGRCLSMHKPFCPYNLRAIGITNRLMAETHAEYRNLSCKCLYHIYRHPCLFRVAGPRRYYYPIRFKSPYLLYRNLVITIHPHILAQFTKILNKVVGKRVIVVNHE